jgi:hypothetical protein
MATALLIGPLSVGRSDHQSLLDRPVRGVARRDARGRFPTAAAQGGIARQREPGPDLLDFEPGILKGSEEARPSPLPWANRC